MPWDVQVLGAPVSAGLLLLDGRGGLRGWQHLFLILGLVTVAYALVVAVRASLLRSTSFCAPSAMQRAVSVRRHSLAPGVHGHHKHHAICNAVERQQECSCSRLVHVLRCTSARKFSMRCHCML